MATKKKAPRRLKAMDSSYLEPDRRELLDKLVAKTRVPRAVLLREAVDDLLVKHRMLRKPKT